MRNNVADGVLHKVRHIVHLLLLADFNDIDLLRQRAFVLLLGDKARLIHARKHLVGALVGDFHLVALIHVLARVVAVRRLREPREHGAFANSQFGKLLAKVVHGGGFHAVVRLAQRNIVQVRFQNLIFRDDGFHFESKVRFLNLALVVALGTEDFVFNKLLGNRAAAGGIAVAQDFQRGGKQSLKVHAGMLVKAHVLNGDERVFEHVGNVFYIHPVTVFYVRDGRKQVAVHIVEVARAVGNRQLRHVQRRRRFNIRLDHAHQQAETDKANHDERQNQHFKRRKQNRQKEGTRFVAFL
ncbi:hypothetical protein SDC9_84166 [bioreactor metagenome]|uniref:Uncharacterized protein n=1 Tax=bioreactor metagenome TaxID=1076179 RepID=A0A644ZB84_9ZZZZ